MGKTKIKFFCNGLILVAFGAIALASSSTKDVYDSIDGFVDGWQGAKSYTSIPAENNDINAIDSISPELPLVANN